MNTAEVIERVESEGVSLTLTPSGGLDVSGDKEAVGRVLPFLRNHKAEIVDLLTKKQRAWVVEGSQAITPSIKITTPRKRQVNCQAYEQTGVLMSTSPEHCREWQGAYCSGCALLTIH